MRAAFRSLALCNKAPHPTHAIGVRSCDMLDVRSSLYGNRFVHRVGPHPKFSAVFIHGRLPKYYQCHLPSYHIVGSVEGCMWDAEHGIDDANDKTFTHMGSAF
jgi:hypothetical protein